MFVFEFDHFHFSLFLRVSPIKLDSWYSSEAQQWCVREETNRSGKMVKPSMASYFGLSLGAFIFWQYMDKLHVWIALRQDEKVRSLHLIFSFSLFISIINASPLQTCSNFPRSNSFLSLTLIDFFPLRKTLDIVPF